MISPVKILYRLQQLMQAPGSCLSGQSKEIAALRAQVDRLLLGHFDRQLAQRRKGVSLVRHGVCGECHLRLPVGTLINLIHSTDAHVCEMCGCFLLLPDEEIPSALRATGRAPRLPATRPPRPSRRPRLAPSST